MLNYKGMSYSIVGDQKVSPTSLNRNIEISIFKLGNINTTFGLTSSRSKKAKDSIKEVISIKPKLIDLSKYQNLGFQSNLVGIDQSLGVTEDITASPRLINYVEPYVISGLRKTLFFTEVNSGLKVGDRVFIIGGNYDIDLLIKSDKWKGGRDGYKVLFVDKCKIVLDIDWTGELVWNSEPDDNFTRVWAINNIDQFISAEKALTTRGGTFSRKFNVGEGNIIWSDKNWGPVNVWGKNVKITESPGFFVRSDTPSLSVDLGFNSSNSGFNEDGEIFTIKQQLDGKILVGGSFTSYNGVSVGRIVRLNTDGSLDTSFISGSGFNDTVLTIDVQSTGRIIVGGKFTTYNGINIGRSLCGLNSSGVIDSPFQSILPTLLNARINTICVDSGDKIYVGGRFVGGIRRLNSNGTLDTGFVTGSGINSGFRGIGKDLVKVIKLQSDGKVLVGGSFISWRGHVTSRKIIRILTNGDIDTQNFDSGLFQSSSISVNDIHVQSDDRIIIVGNFNQKIIRFNPDCTVDYSFIGIDIDGVVNSVFEVGGNIFIGGSLINHPNFIWFDSINGGVWNTSSNFNGPVNKLLLVNFGSFNFRLLVGGDFTKFNSLEINKLAKIEETNWRNITADFISGNISPKLKVVGSDSFTYSIFEEIEFKPGCVYNFTEAEEPNNYIGTYSTWRVDVTYQRPVITRASFRGGYFNGDWKGGVFGRGDKKIKWSGVKSKWNNGTLLNTKWISGDINSDLTLPESYYVDLTGGLPTQKLNGFNNNGRGYNFIIDSEIINSKIESGTIINSQLGVGTVRSVVENEVLGTSSQFDVSVDRGYIESSKLYSVSVVNSELRDSRTKWSLLNNVKFINSYTKKSFTKNSDYISDNIIKINGYDEVGIRLITTFAGNTHKIFKFYISESSYNRLKNGDTFYLKGIVINDGRKDLVNFFDKKFKISSWWDHVDSISNSSQFYKRKFDCAAFLSTPKENEIFQQSYSVDIIYSLLDSDNILNPINFEGLVDFTSAYILDSDYESGVISSSNWNSGYHINTLNDLHITSNPSVGGFYNLDLVGNQLVVNTGFNELWREYDLDLIEEGDLVFLNSVSYDTRGKILSFTISNAGSGYTNGDILGVSGSGTGAQFQITANPTGSVTGISITSGGSGYVAGPPGSGQYDEITTTGGFGTGLTVNIQVNNSGQVIVATINNPGIGYSVGDVISIDGNSSGSGATISVNSVTNGEVIGVDLIQSGIGYSVGPITLLGGLINSVITIQSVTGSITTLPDTYKIVNINGNQLTLEEVTNGTQSLTQLLDGGTFYTPGALNRWGHIHSLKWSKNSIKSGLLKAVYLKNNLIKNSEINLDDRDFNNSLLFKELLISDSIFANGDNILSKATYFRSNLVGGTDYWDDGLFNNSVWNGGEFRRGLFKESSWHDGNFKAGTFYSSRSFNAQPNTNSPFYDTERIRSYWKSGITSATISNDRWSWRTGTFSSGEFIKSDWEGGNFLNGKIFNSKWYSGQFTNGIIGDRSIPFEATHFYNGLIKNAIVENASLFAEDTSLFGLSQSNLVWETGIFNGGVFGCDIIIQTTASHTATWFNGTFNAGEFRTNGKWVDGQFNGGKFISGFGWTWSSSLVNISTSASQFAWENGEFNGGEFGNASLGTNSTWWSGEFNGGEFTGRYWNDGIFTGGRFIGSATYSPVAGYSVDSMEVSNAQYFLDSFSQSFYGVWGGGFASDVKDDFIKDKKLFSVPIRKINDRLINKTVVDFKNMLWMSGTFSHPGGVIDKSLWLSGSFNRGVFKESSFNPWVIRPGDSLKSFDLNDDLVGVSGSCIWIGGRLEESDFYISQWKSGRFISGTAFGMVWKNGIVDYMNAWNVFWEDGLWKNGNWNGSFIDVHETGGVNLQETSLDFTNNFHNQILYRGMNWNGTSSVHLWNVFEDQYNNIETQGFIEATDPNIIPITYYEANGIGISNI
jgi:uncharacterized delta-60 repeat protein